MFGKRVFPFPAIMLNGTLIFGLATVGRATPHEVTVYSFFTDVGRAGAPRHAEDRVRCRLFSGGYQEIGVARSRPPSPPPAPELVTTLMAEALRTNGFHCGQREDDVALMLICQWGHLEPPSRDVREAGSVSGPERLRILALVGGAVLAKADPSERVLILEAAEDERYFVVLSAYDFPAYVREKAQRLFWRTFISVPATGLTQEQAASLMIPTAATLLGRETLVPRRITVDVAGTLRPSIRIE